MVWAQSQGSLRGRVTDPNDASVPIAKITLIEQETSLTRSTVSNDAGEYSFPSVTPGTYTVQAEAPGFKQIAQKGVVVSTQTAVSVDLKMEIGQVTETINVTEAAPILEVSDASTGQVLDRDKLEDLPNLGRNPFILSRLTQTVVWTGNPKFDRMQDQSGSSQISIAGGPVQANNYTLDGISITDSTNRATIIPAQEAVEEVKVQANTYDAEMGRTGGGVFNTTLRSGTNRLHGSAFGLIRETDWLANNFFANRAGQAIPDQPFKNYGASLGGPVWFPKVYNGRNKTFFFVSFEGYRQFDAASSLFAVPTVLEKKGDFSQSKVAPTVTAGGLQLMYDPTSTNLTTGARTPFSGNVIPVSRLSQIGLNMASYYPDPNGVTSYYGANNYTSTVRAFNRADQGTYKLDHQLFSWFKASLSYLHYGSQEPSNRWFPNQTGTPNQGVIYRKTDATQANGTITLSPTTIASVRWGYNRFPNFTPPISKGFSLQTLGFPASVDALTPAYPAFPSITTGEFLAYGGGTTSQSVYYSSSYNASVTKFMGKHSVKVGLDWRAIHNDAITSLGPSSFGFSSAFTSQTPTKTVNGTGGGLATMLLGYPSSGSIALGTNFFNYVHYGAFFIQDDYRITPKLTLNFGFRGERESNPADENNKFAIDADLNATNPLQPSIPSLVLKGAFRYAGVDGNPNHAGNPYGMKYGPRFGFAYSYDTKTVIRGGYGIFWIPQSFSAQNAPGYSFTTNMTTSINNNYTPNLTLNNPYPNGLTQPVGNSLGALTNVGSTLSAVDPGNRSPGYVEQMSLDGQRQVTNTTVVSAGYIGSHTLKQPFNISLNELNPAYYSLGSAGLSKSVPNPFFGIAPNTTSLGTSSTISQSTLLTPYPEYTSVTMSSPMGRSIYYAFYGKFNQRLSNGLSILATYTRSRNMTLVAPQTSTMAIVPQGWGRASTDRPNNFSMAVTYQLPFGKGQKFLSGNRWLDLAVGGWTINTTGLISSGSPLSITQTNNSVGCNGCIQRPNATGIDPATTGSVDQRIDGWLNLAAFSQAPAYTYGNLSATIPVYGPGMFNFDASMFKTFSVKEHYKFQFRAEALNATNTVLFANPTASSLSINSGATFGTITSQTNYPRLIQLGFRFTF
jgi:hypothetical protein